MRTIACFSNPFGLGPLGRMIKLLSILPSEEPTKLIFCGNSFSSAITGLSEGEYIKINERDPDAVYELLATLRPTVVVSSLNRFALSAAKRLSIPSVLFDDLTWFWKELPPGFELADLYIYQKFPGTEHIAKRFQNVLSLPVITIKKAEKMKSSDELFYLGGVVNPLYPQGQVHYISLLGDVLAQLPLSNHAHIISADYAVSLLREQHPKLASQIEALPQKEFHQLMCRSRSIAITAGMNTTLEALAMGQPVYFLPPSNQSQYALQRVLMTQSNAFKGISWNEFGVDESFFNGPSELEVIGELERQLGQMRSKSDMMVEITDRLRALLHRSDATLLANQQQWFTTTIGCITEEDARIRVGEKLRILLEAV
jgi:hypothetical protein